MAQVIPMTNDARQTFRVVLDGQVVRLRAWWQPLDGAWYCSLQWPDQTYIAASMRLTEQGRPMRDFVTSFRGELYCWGSGEPGRMAWTTGHVLLHLTETDIADSTYLTPDPLTLFEGALADDAMVEPAPLIVDTRPIANAGADQAGIMAGATVMLDGSLSRDPGGSIASYAWTQTAGTTVMLTGASSARPTFPAPSTGAAQTLTFQLMVTDNDGETNTDTVNVGILAMAVDQMPSFPTVANRMADFGSSVDVTLPMATGGDAPLTYSISGLPNGLSFDATTRRVTGTPNMAETANVTYVVTDVDNDTDSAMFTWEIEAVIPGAPQNLMATANGMTQIDLSWDAPASNGGAAITGYRIDVSEDNSAFTPLVASQAGTTYEHMGLSAGDQRYYRVYAINSVGTSTAFASDDATTMAAMNQPPVANAGADQTNVLPGATVTLDSSGSSDPDGTIASRLWSQTAGTTVTLSDTAAESPTFTAPSEATAQTLTFQVLITDGDGGTSTDTVNIGIQADLMPALAAIPTLTGDFGTTFDTTLPEATGGNTPITYSVSTLLPGWAFDAATRQLTGTYQFVGNITVVYTATDADGDTATQNVIIHTDAVVPGAPQGINAVAQSDTEIRIAWQAPSSNGGTAITGYRIDVSTDGTTFTTLVATQTAREYRHMGLSSGDRRYYRVYAINSVGTSTDYAEDDTRTLRLPVANAGADQANIVAGATVTLDGSGSTDPDGTIQTYLWEQTAGDTVTLDDSSAIMPEFTAPSEAAAQTLTFRLTITDNHGLISTDTVDIGVLAHVPDLMPTLDDHASITGTFGVAVNLLFPVATGGNLPLTYSMTQIPPGLSFNPATRRVTGTPSAPANLMTVYMVEDADGDTDSVTFNWIINAVLPGAPENLSVMADGQNQIDLSWDAPASSGGLPITGYRIDVSEDNTTFTTLVATQVATTYSHMGLSAAQRRYYRVYSITNHGTSTLFASGDAMTEAAPNQSPVANAGPDQSNIAGGATVTLDGSGSSDPDGTIASYAWTQISGTTVMLSDPAVAQPTFTAPMPLSDETLEFQLQVTDDGGLTATDTVSIGIDGGTHFGYLSAITGVDTNDAAFGSYVVEFTAETSGTDLFDHSAGDGTLHQFFPTDMFTDDSIYWLERYRVRTNEIGFNRGASSINQSAFLQTWTNDWTVYIIDTSNNEYLMIQANSATRAGSSFIYWPYSDGNVATVVAKNIPTNMTPEDWVQTHLGDRLVVALCPARTYYPANSQPLANAGPDQTNVAAGSTVTLDGSGSSDPDGTIQTYAWSQTSGDTVVLSDTAAEMPTFTAPSAGSAQDLVFSLTVTDNDGATDTSTVTISVLAQ